MKNLTFIKGVSVSVNQRIRKSCVINCIERGFPMTVTHEQ